MGPTKLHVNPIFEIGPLEPRFSEWLVFEGLSVDESGKQHYLDASIAYKRAVLNCIDYLSKFGYTKEQVSLSLLLFFPMTSFVCFILQKKMFQGFPVRTCCHLYFQWQIWKLAFLGFTAGFVLKSMRLSIVYSSIAKNERLVGIMMFLKSFVLMWGFWRCCRFICFCPVAHVRAEFLELWMFLMHVQLLPFQLGSLIRWVLCVTCLSGFVQAVMYYPSLPVLNLFVYTNIFIWDWQEAFWVYRNWKLKTEKDVMVCFFCSFTVIYHIKLVVICYWVSFLRVIGNFPSCRTSGPRKVVLWQGHDWSSGVVFPQAHMMGIFPPP